MKVRELGFRAMEIEVGPYVFLVSASVPVAYRDKSPSAVPPGWYRTDKFFSKGTTAHLNKWLKDKEHATVLHAHILRKFADLDYASGVREVRI